MKIEELMTRRVVAARADTDLAHVARLMWDNDCGCVPVVDAEDKVVGLLTDRDLCMGAHFSGRPLAEMRAAACMAGEVHTCRAGEAPTAVAKRMGSLRVRRMPVTDEEGRLIGLVSIGDLLAAAQGGGAKDRKALHAALVQALTEICARPTREEVAPAAPPKRARARKAEKSEKSDKRAGKKRAKV